MDDRRTIQTQNNKMAKQLKASTITEFVIAITLIGIAFTIGANIISNITRSSQSFQISMDETEFQNEIFNFYILDTLYDIKWENKLTEIEKTQDENEKEIKNYSLISEQQNIITQEIVENESKIKSILNH